MAMIKKMKAIGMDGFAMLGISNVLILLSLGLTLLLLVLYVLRAAYKSPACVMVPGWVVVPGMCLSQNAPNAEFKRRLDRAASLASLAADSKVIILGGVTGNSTVSEAVAGRAYLSEQGVAESRIVLEEQSNNTLENFRFAKAEMDLANNDSVVIVSSRYHLARCGVMAKSLGMQPLLCAAEEDFSFGPKNLLLVLKEAYHLHWYFSGRYWARATGNKKMLARLQ